MSSVTSVTFRGPLLQMLLSGRHTVLSPQRLRSLSEYFGLGYRKDCLSVTDFNLQGSINTFLAGFLEPIGVSEYSFSGSKLREALILSLLDQNSAWLAAMPLSVEVSYTRLTPIPKTIQIFLYTQHAGSWSKK